MSSRWRRRTVVKRHGNAVTPRLYRLPAPGRHLLILLRREGNTTPRGDWIATPQIHWPTFNTSVRTYYHIKYRLPEIYNQRLAMRILHEYAVLLMMSSSKYQPLNCFIWRWNYCKINPLPPDCSDWVQRGRRWERLLKVKMKPEEPVTTFWREREGTISSLAFK